MPRRQRVLVCDLSETARANRVRKFDESVTVNTVIAEPLSTSQLVERGLESQTRFLESGLAEWCLERFGPTIDAKTHGELQDTFDELIATVGDVEEPSPFSCYADVDTEGYF